jgi:hypothetical protein
MLDAFIAPCQSGIVRLLFTMRADICDSNDEVAIARFRGALRRLGAHLDDKSWALGVNLYRLRIGDEELSVFSDEWSLDIEGSDDLVKRVLREYAHPTV